MRINVLLTSFGLLTLLLFAGCSQAEPVVYDLDSRKIQFKMFPSTVKEKVYHYINNDVDEEVERKMGFIMDDTIITKDIKTARELNRLLAFNDGSTQTPYSSIVVTKDGKEIGTYVIQVGYGRLDWRKKSVDIKTEAVQIREEMKVSPIKLKELEEMGLRKVLDTYFYPTGTVKYKYDVEIPELIFYLLENGFSAYSACVNGRLLLGGENWELSENQIREIEKQMDEDSKEYYK